MAGGEGGLEVGHGRNASTWAASLAVLHLASVALFRLCRYIYGRVEVPLEQDEPVLEFRASSMRVLAVIAKGVFVAVLLGGVLAAVMMLGLLPIVWPQGPPVGAMVAAGAVILLFWLWLVWVFDRREPSRLRINSDSVWLGGRFFGASLNIDDIGLIELNHPTREWTGLLLVLTLRTGRKWSINLPTNEARTCFFNLHELCGHAPAIDEEASFFPPRDPAHHERARQVLGAAFRRKARLARNTALYCLILTPFIVVLLFAGTNHYIIWFAIVSVPITAVVSWRESRVYRQQAEAAVAEWGVDEAFVEDEQASA